MFEDYHSEDCLNRPIFITIHQKLQILVVISSCQVEPIIMSRVIITQQRNCISVLYDVSQHTAAQNRCHISHILKPLSPRTITVTYMELRLGAVSVLQLLLTNPKYHCLNWYGTNTRQGIQEQHLPSARQHPSYGDCLEVKREYYQNSSVLDCVTQCSQSAEHSSISMLWSRLSCWHLSLILSTVTFVLQPSFSQHLSSIAIYPSSG